MAKVPVTGTELYYVSKGAGYPLLVMHGGLGVSHEVLTPALDPLGDVFELIYYDHRANGRSGRTPKETRTHARLADDAAEGELESYNMIPRLGEIETPALVVCGRYDFVCPPSKSEIMHDGLPNSELVIFEESGHFPFVEEAELFFETVRGWFKGLEKPGF